MVTPDSRAKLCSSIPNNPPIVRKLQAICRDSYIKITLILLDLELLCSWTLSTVIYVNKEHKIAETGCLYNHVKEWADKHWLRKTLTALASFIYIPSLCLGSASYKYTLDEDTNINPLNPLVQTYNILKFISQNTVNNSYQLQKFVH